MTPNGIGTLPFFRDATPENRVQAVIEDPSLFEYFIEWGEYATLSQRAFSALGKSPTQKAMALAKEMAKQASLGHTQFCCGIYPEIKAEWVTWDEAFGRLFAVLAPLDTESE